jgi:hypothetical protein
MPPPQMNPSLDDEDDAYRTRMGDPYQPQQQSGRLPPPVSRPNSHLPSRPAPPRSNPQMPAWNDPSDQDQDTAQHPAWPPNNPPQR